MKRSLLVSGAGVVALVAALAFAHHGPDQVVLDAAAQKQPPVPFQHAQHTQVVKDCATCHHTQKGLTSDAGTKVQRCASCHLDPTSAEVPSMRQASLKTNPFHALCISCHKQEAKGPTACKQCHVKG